MWFAWKLLSLRYKKQPPFLWRDSWHCCDLLENYYLCAIRNNRQCYQDDTYELWFAWKILSLRYKKQRCVWHDWPDSCCDLLENYYLCAIRNNGWHWCCSGALLWFAWKLLSLRYKKQLDLLLARASMCCDLLENYYLCAIRNNYGDQWGDVVCVVICLKIIIFAL